MKKTSQNVYKLETPNYECLEVQLTSSQIKITVGAQEFCIPLQQQSPDPTQLKVQIDKSFQYFNSISPTSSISSEYKHVLKGLLCANRECCRIVNGRRTAYCSHGCQIREYNLRYGRVALKQSLFVRKQYVLKRIYALEGDFDIEDIVRLIKEIDENKYYAE